MTKKCRNAGGGEKGPFGYQQFGMAADKEQHGSNLQVQLLTSLELLSVRMHARQIGTSKHTRSSFQNQRRLVGRWNNDSPIQNFSAFVPSLGSWPKAADKPHSSPPHQHYCQCIQVQRQDTLGQIGENPVPFLIPPGQRKSVTDHITLEGPPNLQSQFCRYLRLPGEGETTEIGT